MVLADRSRWIFYAAICTVASVLGAFLGYFIGAFLYVYPMLAPKEDLEHRIIVPDEPDLIDDDSPAQQA